MGFVTESKILKQDKKAQGETNQRLDALIVEQRRTNELLAQLVQILGAQQAQQQYPPAGPAQATTWGVQQPRG